MTDGLSMLTSLGSTPWLGAAWLGIALWQYVTAFLFLILMFFARRVARAVLQRLVLPWIVNMGGIYTSKIIQALIKPLTVLLGLLGVFLAAKVLLLPGGGPGAALGSTRFVNQSFQVAIAAISLWALVRLIDVFGLFLSQLANGNQLSIDAPIITLVQRTLKIGMVVVGSLVVVQQLGYPITSILGGLGIGGLAVALAAQDTLANMFGSVIVFTDKPFKIGDWVRIGEVDGFVEDVGFRSTRIRTWAQSLVVVPNKEIANSRIENWTAMPIRQIYFKLNIAYGAEGYQMDALVKGLQAYVADHEGIDQGYHLVGFTGFGENGLEITIYCFTRSVAWAEHTRVRQELNLEIMRLVENLGLSLAMPGRRVYFAGCP